MIEILRKLEKSGLIDDVIIEYTEDGITKRKGSLSTFNLTVRSITEKQPERRRITAEIFGRDGEYEFSEPANYTPREFTIVFNIYAEVGNREGQRNDFVIFLLSHAEGGKLMFSRRRNTYYDITSVDIGAFAPDTNARRRKWESTLTVKIKCAPKYHWNGEVVI